jgi:CheY-like chemotaxis protein
MMSQATLLHIEDDPNDVLLFQHACQKAGASCNLQVVADGDEAVAYLSGSGKFGDRSRFPLPKLVLLDLKMPRLNGIEAMTWIRKDRKLARLPVVVLSSSNHDVDIQRAYDAGANSYLVKPVDFNALVDIAKALVGYWLALNVPAE